VVFVRFGIGLVALVFSGLMVKSAAQRLIRGLATMFAGAVAFAIGISLIATTIFTAIRHWRRRKQAA
jgi:hypothetical protein